MADIGRAKDGFPRRMQAARAIAGLGIDKLAEKISEPGLSARSLRNIESGKVKDVQRSRQVAIIEACGLPAAFIFADFWTLEAVEHGIEALPAEVRADGERTALVLRAFKALAAQSPDEVERTEQRLQDVEKQVDEILKRLPPAPEPEIPTQLPADPKSPPKPPDDDAEKRAAN